MAAGLPWTNREGGVARLAWLLLALAGGFALPAVSESRRPASSTDMRQLTSPYKVPLGSSRLMRGLRARHGRPMTSPRRASSAARSILSSQLTGSGHGRWRGYRPLATRQVLSGAPAGLRERWTDAGRDFHAPGLRKTSLMRRPPISRDILVDQLLIIPREDGYGDDRLQSLARLGIPVFRDVPAIVIINPQAPERDRFGTPLRHPAR